MKRYIIPMVLSIIAGIVVTLIFSYAKGDWPFEQSR